MSYYQRNINSSPAFFKIEGKNNESTRLIFSTSGLNAISIVIQAHGGKFNGQNYIIQVSGDGKDWTSLYEFNLGFDNVVGNSFSVSDALDSPLNFPFILVAVLAIEGISTSIVVSAR